MVLAFLLLIASAAQVEEPAQKESQVLVLLDRIVAIVDEDPIFLSDLRRAAGLAGVDLADADRSSHGSLTVDDQPLDERQLLDRLIDERLQGHEVERRGAAPVPRSEIERQIAAMQSSAGGTAGFDQQLKRLNMDRAQAEQLIRRQLRVLAYVEERLGPLVFVADEEVRAYFDGSLRAELSELGRQLPDFAEVKPAIRALLREMALNRRIEEWTDDLRRQANINDLLDQPISAEELPSVIIRLESEG